MIYLLSGERDTSRVIGHFEGDAMMAFIRTEEDTFVVEVSTGMFLKYDLQIYFMIIINIGTIGRYVAGDFVDDKNFDCSNGLVKYGNIPSPQQSFVKYGMRRPQWVNCTEGIKVPLT